MLPRFLGSQALQLLDNSPPPRRVEQKPFFLPTLIFQYLSWTSPLPETNHQRRPGRYPVSSSTSSDECIAFHFIRLELSPNSPSSSIHRNSFKLTPAATLHFVCLSSPSYVEGGIPFLYPFWVAFYFGLGYPSKTVTGFEGFAVSRGMF